MFGDLVRLLLIQVQKQKGDSDFLSSVMIIYLS